MAPAATPSTANGVESWNQPVMAIRVVYIQKEEGSSAEETEREVRSVNAMKIHLTDVVTNSTMTKWIRPTCRRAEHSSAQDQKSQHEAADMQTEFLANCPVMNTNKPKDHFPSIYFYINGLSCSGCSESKLTCRNRVHRRSRRMLRHIAQSRTPTPAKQSWHICSTKVISVCAMMLLGHLETRVMTSNRGKTLTWEPLPCLSAGHGHANRLEEHAAISMRRIGSHTVENIPMFASLCHKAGSASVKTVNTAIRNQQKSTVQEVRMEH